MIEWHDLIHAAHKKVEAVDASTIGVLRRKCIADNLRPVEFKECVSGKTGDVYWRRVTIMLEHGELIEPVDIWFHKNKPISGSSNGRKADFESVNRGSIPRPETKNTEREQ